MKENVWFRWVFITVEDTYICIYNSIMLGSNSEKCLREVIMERYGKRLMNVRYCLSKYCRTRQLCQLLINLCLLLLDYILIICKLLLF